MSIKKYWEAAVIGVPVLVGLLVAAIIVNINNNNIVGAQNEDDWSNFDELSSEFLDQYFGDYAAMRANGDPENILMVTSKTRPEEYGAVSVVEAPDYLYFLEYNSAEERDAAFSKFEASGVKAERNQKVELMGDYMSWGIEKMSLDKTIDKIETLENPEEFWVAVIDTGIDMETFETAFPNRVIQGYSVMGDDPTDVEDRHNDKHGTNVAGIVADGTTDNVNILAIKVSDSQTGDDINIADVATAVYYARTQNAEVINMSLGGPEPLEALENALETTEEAGIINIASAGNFGVDTLFYPASYDSVISIAAVDSNLERWSDAQGASNYGEKIEFAAPGVSVPVASGWAMKGTSIAAPHIAAAAANLKSFTKDVDMDYTRETFRANAIDLGDEGWDQYYGWGFVDFKDAEFCETGDTCDKYGIFKVDYLVDNKTDGKATYSIKDDVMTVASDTPTMAIASTNDGYVRVPAIATTDANVYKFNLLDSESEEITLVLVGDVTMDGTVSSSDSAAIDHALLSKTNTNYEELTELQKVIADVTKNGRINSLDSIAIDYSLLPNDNANYHVLDW